MDPSSQPSWEASALEQRLLDAARHDRIPDALGAHMAEGLGLQLTAGGALASSSASVAPAAKLGVPLFGKAGLWGALSLSLLAAGGWQLARSSSPEPTRAPRASEHAAPAPRPVTATPVLAAGASSASTPAASAPKPADQGVKHTRPSARPDDGALRAEIALLDRARAALREGDATRARRLLAQHERRFADAALAPEAAALLIEALVQERSYAQAASLSERFASAYPSHPLRERVLALAGSRGSTGTHE